MPCDKAGEIHIDSKKKCMFWFKQCFGWKTENVILSKIWTGDELKTVAHQEDSAVGTHCKDTRFIYDLKPSL